MARDTNGNLTKREELFCQNITAGRKILEAYALAGYSTRGKESTRIKDAQRILTRPKVIERLAELAQQTNERFQMDRERLVEMALRAFAMAEQQEQPTPMIQAVATIARMTGHWMREDDQGDGEPILLTYHVPENSKLPPPIEGEFTKAQED
jgi:phage terminase small subunit